MTFAHYQLRLAAALVLANPWLWGCGKAESPATGSTSGESLQIDDPKLLPAARGLDKVAGDLASLVQRAEAAQSTPLELVAIRREYQATLAQARSQLAELERQTNPADRRTLNAYYLQVVAPQLSRLQPLLFPALLVELPRGATPAEAATPTTATAAITPTDK
jgi:hypothetical protein